MNQCHRKPRPLAREDRTYRDDRLFVIATEDTFAPRQYFVVFRNPRIKVRVLPTESGRSAPNHVLDRLKDYKREFETMDGDELWLMLDTDHWVEPNHVANFNMVCAQAKKKGFHLAHSNPCFELWLLLHVAELAPDERLLCSDDVIERLRQILGGYNKNSIPSDQFTRESIGLAMERAERLDRSPNDRWPQKTGTHVYKVVKELMSDEKNQ